MKKRLSEEEFASATSGLDVSQKTLDIAHGVLVLGKSQAEFVKLHGITKGAVWQAVQRVWEAHQQLVPNGYERITAVLPEHKAYLVKQWERDVKRKLK